MKYKVGDKIRVKSREWYEKNKDVLGDINTIPNGFNKRMSKYCGREATIVWASESRRFYRIDIDYQQWNWNDAMFEDITEVAKEEQTTFRKLKYKIGDRVRIKSLEWYEHNKSAEEYVCTVCGFIEDMREYCGKEAVITGIRKDSYRVDIDNGFWSWGDEMFEDASEKTKSNLMKNELNE